MLNVQAVPGPSAASACHIDLENRYPRERSTGAAPRIGGAAIVTAGRQHAWLAHKSAHRDTWLSIMQHFGAPTRLVDFTWSPFVAGFFALERATADAAVWGISLTSLHDVEVKFPHERRRIRTDQLGMRAKGNYERYFLGNEVPFVVAGEPTVMNQRLVAQSGTFIVPGILNRSIDDILASYPKSRQTLTKFVLKTAELRDEAMYSFYNMNITSATLFPGLDGLAKSLAYELEFHWAFNPRTMERYPGY